MSIENTRALTDVVFNTRFDKIEATDTSKLTYAGAVAKSVSLDGVKKIHMNTGMGVVSIFKDEGKYVYDCSDEELEKVFLGMPITMFFTEDVFAVIPMKTSY